MTSANISNMFVAPVQPKGPEVSTVEDKSGIGFMDIMAKSMDATPKLANANIPEAKRPERNDITSVSIDSTKVDIKDAKKDTLDSVSPDKKEEIKESGVKLEEDVKEAIADELDVSVEEVEKVMEILGLTVLDLSDTNNLAQLVTELTGGSDAVALVLSDSFAAINDAVSTLVNEFVEESGLSLDDIKGILIENASKDKTSFGEILQNNLTNNQISQPITATNEAVNENDSEESFIQNGNVVVMDSDESKEIELPKEPKPESFDKLKSEIVNKGNHEISEDSREVQESEFTFKSETTKDSESNSSMMNNSSENGAQFRQPKESIFSDKAGTVINAPEAPAVFEPLTDQITLPTGESVNVSEIINQIVEQAKAMADSSSTTLQMILNPEGLGKVFMEVTQKGEEVTAKLFTQNEAVKEALESQLATLRENINSNTTTKVTSIEVAVGTHEFEENLEQDAHNQEKQGEEQVKSAFHRRHSINLNSLDELSGLMSEEDMLVASMMKDNGNTVNYTI